VTDICRGADEVMRAAFRQVPVAADDTEAAQIVAAYLAVHPLYLRLVRQEMESSGGGAHSSMRR
jgi:transketolase C-terminal domain/subunit